MWVRFGEGLFKGWRAQAWLDTSAVVGDKRTPCDVCVAWNCMVYTEQMAGVVDAECGFAELVCAVGLETMYAIWEQGVMGCG